MARPFGFEGVKGTCLWCGRKHRERVDRVWTEGTRISPSTPAPKVGDRRRFAQEDRTVRSVTPMTGIRSAAGRFTYRKAKEGDPIECYALRYDPPAWEGWVDEDGTPLLCTDSCAARFGFRLAELGHRLQFTAAARRARKASTEAE